jgi:hypothetical protein
MFWDYFKNTLRLPFIANPGQLAMLAEGGADILDASRDDALTLRDQFLPERCEAANLKHFAACRGIVRAQLEPEIHWQGRVRLAYLWHIRGGRAGGLAATLVGYFGFTAVQVVNLRAEDPARWAEFRVICDLGGVSPWFEVNQVTWAINELKPARSKLAEVQYINFDVYRFRAGESAAGEALSDWDNPNPNPT